MAAAIAVVRAREQRYPTSALDDDAVYFTSPATVSRASLEYRALAADLYWIRAVQYFGGTRRMLQQGTANVTEDRRRYAALFAMLDLKISLGARIYVAYRFGTIVHEAAP